MWNLIKDDPILKAIMVFVLGLFSFSFAFSIMFGSGQSGTEHGSSTGVTNAANNMGQSSMEHGASSVGGSGAIYGLTQVISMLTRVFIIIILIALIIAAVKLIKKHIIGNEPINIFDKIKDKPISAAFLGAAGILTMLYMAGIIMSGNVGNNMAYVAAGNVLVLAVRLVSVISVIGLITGLTMYFKERYFTNTAATAAGKENCLVCGHELRGIWKCCPICGNENGSDKVIASIDDTKINSTDDEE